MLILRFIGQTDEREAFYLNRGTSVAASIALMLVVIIIAVASVAELKKTTTWRDQTFQAILDAQTF